MIAQEPAPPEINMGYGPTVDHSTSKPANDEQPHTGIHHSMLYESSLLEDVRRQVEFYFSLYNYANDAYLQQFATAYGGSVPSSVIASFPKVRELFANANLLSNISMHPPAEIQILAKALENSELLAVSPDGLWITPFQPLLGPMSMYATPGGPLPPMSQPPSVVVSPQGPLETSLQGAAVTQSNKERSTVIVRDLPLECDIEDVMNAFTTESVCPKSAKPDVGNTWYVTFQSESQAVEALAASMNRLIAGHPIRARLKSALLSTPLSCTNAAAPSRHVDATEYNPTQHSFLHHPPQYNIPMPQQHPVHNGAMHQPPPRNMVMSQIHQANMIYANAVTYGVTAIYPPSNFYMDHPQHLMPVVPPHMGYSAASVDSGSTSDNTTTHRQQNRKPSQGFVRSQQRNNNNRNNSESDGYGGDKKNHRKRYKKKNSNGTLNSCPSNDSDNRKKNPGGERRVDMHESSRYSPTTGELNNAQKERRESPTHNHHELYKKNTSANNGDGKKRNNNNSKNKKKYQRDNASSSKTLKEDFPALVTKSKEPRQNERHILPQQERVAYAEAVRKPATMKEIQTGFEEIAVSTLEQDEALCW